MNTRLLALLAAGGLLSACNGGPGNKDNNDDTGPSGNDDTGDIVYEEGCIALSTGETFAWIEDAIKVANDGDTIALGDCGETFDQQAIVTKGVRIEGPGAGVMVWNAPVNMAAIEISGANGASVSGFTFTSTRDGILVESATNTLLDANEFVSIANTAVVTRNSTDTTVSNSLFTAPAYGAVQVDNGTATVDGNTVENPLGFAVRSTDGSTVTVSNNTVSGTLYTSLDNGLIDGFALWGDGGHLVTDSNVLTDNVVHVWTEEADLTASGDVMSGGTYGIIAQLGAHSVDGVTITDAYSWGAILVGQNDDVSLTNSTISGDPDLVFTSDDPDPAAWSSAGAVLLRTDSLATVSGVTITGYNARGLEVSPYSNRATLEMSDTLITNAGRYGLTLNETDATLTDVQVEDTRLHHDPATVNQASLSVGFGVLVQNATVDWTGGGLADSEVINLVAFSSNMTFDDIVQSGGGSMGIAAVSSTTVIQNSTLTDSPNQGALANYSGDMVIDANTFVDNQKTVYTNVQGYDLQGRAYATYNNGYGGAWTASSGTFTDVNAQFVTAGVQPGDLLYPYSYGGSYEVLSVDSETQLTVDVTFASSGTGSYWAVYQVTGTYQSETYRYFDSRDIVGSAPSSLTITNNTFNTGSDGIFVDSGEITVEGNSWTNYNGSILDIYGGSVEMKDNSIDGAGDYGIFCSNATLDIEELAMANMNGREYKYERYRDGELDYSSSYTYTGSSLYLSSCETVLDEVAISGPNEEGIYASDSSLEFYDVSVSEDESIDNLGYGLVAISWSSKEPSLLGDTVTLTSESSGDALRLYNGYTTNGSVLLEDLTIVGSSDDGISMDGIDAEFSNLTVEDTRGDGLAAIGGSLTLENASVSSNTCSGISLQGDDAQTVTSGSGVGVTSGTSSLSVSGATFETNGVVGGDRIYLNSLRDCPFIISSVDGEEDLTIVGSFPSDGSNLSWSVTSAGTNSTGTLVIDGLDATDNVFGLYVDGSDATLENVTTGGNSVGVVCGGEMVNTSCSAVSSSGDLDAGDYGCCL